MESLNSTGSAGNNSNNWQNLCIAAKGFCNKKIFNSIFSMVICMHALPDLDVHGFTVLNQDVFSGPILHPWLVP